MIGTTAALVMGGIAAANTVKSAVGAHAAGKASKAQQQAVYKGLALQERIWGQQQQNQQPYMQAGQQSANLLGSLMTPQGMPGAYRPPPGMPSGSGFPNPMGQPGPPRSFGPPPQGPPMGGPPMQGPGGPPPPPWEMQGMRQPMMTPRSLGGPQGY